MAIIPNYFISEETPKRIDELPISNVQIPSTYLLSVFLKDPTVAKIEQIRESYPHFQLNSGGRLGWTLLACAIDRNALPAFH